MGMNTASSSRNAERELAEERSREEADVFSGRSDVKCHKIKDQK